jgi:hypothetical protein
VSVEQPPAPRTQHATHHASFSTAAILLAHTTTVVRGLPESLSVNLHGAV